MFSVTGVLINFFHTKANEKYSESFRLQILGDLATKDGQLKKEMLTLTVPRSVYEQYQSHVGVEVTIPVGIFVQNNKLVSFYTGGQELA